MRKLRTWIGFAILSILILFYSTVSEAGIANTMIIGTAPTGLVYANADTIYTDDDLTGDFSIGDEIRILQISDGDSLNSYKEQRSITAITSAYIVD